MLSCICPSSAPAWEICFARHPLLYLTVSPGQIFFSFSLKDSHWKQRKKRSTSHITTQCSAVTPINVAKLSSSRQLRFQLNWDSIITMCLPLHDPIQTGIVSRYGSRLVLATFKHNMKIRITNKFKTEKANTKRYENSAVPYMRRLLNKEWKTWKPNDTRLDP